MAAMAGNFISGAVSGLLGGIMNYNAAKETNEAAQRQFRENMQFQRYQYQDMKHYNSFKNQVRMMREAGLNPSLAFGNGASSVGASSVGGVAPTASRVTPDYSSVGNMASGVVSALSQSSLNTSQEEVNESVQRKNDAEAALSETDIQTRKQENIARIDKLLSDSRTSRAERNFLVTRRAALLKDIEYQDELNTWRNEGVKQQTMMSVYDRTIKEIQRDFLPEFNDMQLQQLASIVRVNSELAQLHNWTSQKTKAEITSEVIRSGILGNEFYDSLPKGLKGKKYYDALSKSPKYRKVEIALDRLQERLKSVPIVGMLTK